MLERKVPGSKLTLTFTDIDLAGHYRGRGGSDVRIVRGEIRPARMSFAFLLQDSAGRTLANGTTRITDNSSQSSLAHHPKRSTPLYYEKRMFSPTGALWLLAGLVITIPPLLAVGVFARIALKMNFVALSGLVAGSMTAPPALAFASNISRSDAPMVSYATVYPLTMVLRILSAQILVLLLCG